jgi:hypothetical protein
VGYDGAGDRRRTGRPRPPALCRGRGSARRAHSPPTISRRHRSAWSSARSAEAHVSRRALLLAPCVMAAAGLLLRLHPAGARGLTWCGRPATFNRTTRSAGGRWEAASATPCP